MGPAQARYLGKLDIIPFDNRISTGPPSPFGALDKGLFRSSSPRYNLANFFPDSELTLIPGGIGTGNHGHHGIGTGKV